MDRTYSHIDLDERRKIARWRTAKLSVDVIAEKLSQKCRERRSKQRKLIRFDRLRQSVIQHISDGWSPQQPERRAKRRPRHARRDHGRRFPPELSTSYIARIWSPDASGLAIGNATSSSFVRSSAKPM